MTGEWVAIITLLIVNIFLCVLLVLQKFDFNSIQGNLLDRIMSRNYETYVQGEALKISNKESLTAEEIYSLQQERGIPVV